MKLKPIIFAMIFKELTSRVPSIIVQSVSKRYLSRSSQRPRPQHKHYRLWAVPGDHVSRRDVLAKQWTMKWHPGLNVGIDADRVIYALCDGVMIITEEKYEPDYSHPVVKQAYMKEDEKMAPPYKRYINVIPKRNVSEFKLIDVV